MPARAAILCLAALAAGCASVPGPRGATAPGADPAAGRAADAAEDPLGLAGSGAPLAAADGFDDAVVSAAFDPSRAGGAPAGAAVRYRRADGSVGVVRPEVPYAAASGRACRRLLGDGGESTGRVLCEAGDGWALVPRLDAR